MLIVTPLCLPFFAFLMQQLSYFIAYLKILPLWAFQRYSQHSLSIGRNILNAITIRLDPFVQVDVVFRFLKIGLQKNFSSPSINLQLLLFRAMWEKLAHLIITIRAEVRWDVHGLINSNYQYIQRCVFNCVKTIQMISFLVVLVLIWVTLQQLTSF